MKKDRIRTRFILSAAVGMAAAIVAGYPAGGWLAEIQPPRSMDSFYLAKAGIDRAVWSVRKGRVPDEGYEKGRLPGFEGTKVFQDVPGGLYSVRADYEPRNDQVRIFATGTDHAGQRSALEVVLRRRLVDGGFKQVLWRAVPP